MGSIHERRKGVMPKSGSKAHFKLSVGREAEQNGIRVRFQKLFQSENPVRAVVIYRIGETEFREIKLDQYNSSKMIIGKDKTLFISLTTVSGQPTNWRVEVSIQ